MHTVTACAESVRVFRKGKEAYWSVLSVMASTNELFDENHFLPKPLNGFRIYKQIVRPSFSSWDRSLRAIILTMNIMLHFLSPGHSSCGQSNSLD